MAVWGKRDIDLKIPKELKLTQYSYNLKGRRSGDRKGDGKDKMTGEGQDQEKWLFWECWVISQPSALTILRNEISHAAHLTTLPLPSSFTHAHIMQTNHYSCKCLDGVLG